MKPSTDAETTGTGLVTASQYVVAVRRPPVLPPLAEADMTRARALASSLAVAEDRLGDIVNVGSGAQAALAKISKEMLVGVRVNALNEVLRLSDGVLAQVRQVRLEDLSPTAGRTLFFLRESAAAIRRRVVSFFRGYELVSRQLDRQEADLFLKEAEATQRFHADARLEQASRQVMLDGRIALAAIELFLASENGREELARRQQAVAEDQAAAAREERALDLTLLTAAERQAKYLERVEMKRTSLQQAILSAYQSSITLRMLEDNENIIRQKLSDIRTELLPQWRTLIAMAYNAYVQQGVADFVRRLEHTEAEIRTKTADQVTKTAASVADLMTRPVFDPVALKYQQDKLIGALETLRAASIEARRIRDAAEETMKRSIDELGQAVASMSAGVE